MYHYFTDKGEVTLPAQRDLEFIIERGLQPTLFIDSCVCIDIIKVIDYKKNAKGVDINKIIKLQEYIFKHSINIQPFFGLIELCSNQETFAIEKFNDFFNRIDFFGKCKPKYFKSMTYDFNRCYLQNRKLTIPNIDGSIVDLIDINYCALLKIRSLAIDGLTKQKALKNINLFMNWLVKDLDIVLGFEFQVAMQIFGGNTEFRKMIGLDSKPHDIKKKLIGSSWDMFNARYATNTNRLKYLLDDDLYGFFATSDKNLYNIFKNNELLLVKNGANICDDSFVYTSNYDLPHLSKSDILEISENNIILFANRGTHVFTRDQKKLTNMIIELELINGIA